MVAEIVYLLIHSGSFGVFLLCSFVSLALLLVREVSSRLLLFDLLADQGQTNTPHPCVQQKEKVSGF